MYYATNTNEVSLDPSDWESVRKLGHRMVEDMVSYLQGLRDRPVWREIPDEVRKELDRPVPRVPEGAEKAYEDFLNYVQPYPHGNHHPRFWGWVNGTGMPLAALAEMLAATLNSNVAGGENSAVLVEEQVLKWMKGLLGFAQESSGLLVSGGSMANFVGLAVAINAKAECDVAADGLTAVPRKMVLYASNQTHSSVEKAVRLLGLGSNALRKIQVDDTFAIDIEVLEEAIARDRAAGLHPFCIVGNAGTTNTGAFDNLDRLADVSQREDLWLHVDGAFGALAALSPTLKKLTSGMERADSLAFDLHKWMYMPYEVGGVLVRDSEAHRNTFAVSADYLSLTEGGIAGDRSWFSEYGLQLSRGFRALKVWMALKEHGVEKFGRVIEQNVDQARYLARLVEESPDLELLAPVTLNVVCFRFKGPTYCRDDELNELNSDLLIKLQESGVAAPSHTVIGGKFALRVANTNHRTRKDDFFVLVREVERLGRELVNTHPTVFCATEKTASSWDNWKPPGRGAVGVKGLR